MIGNNRETSAVSVGSFFFNPCRMLLTVKCRCLNSHSSLVKVTKNPENLLWISMHSFGFWYQQFYSLFSACVLILPITLALFTWSAESHVSHLSPWCHVMAITFHGVPNQTGIWIKPRYDTHYSMRPNKERNMSPCYSVRWWFPKGAVIFILLSLSLSLCLSINTSGSATSGFSRDSCYRSQTYKKESGIAANEIDPTFSWTVYVFLC